MSELWRAGAHSPLLALRAANANERELVEQVSRASDWLVNEALPLWANSGYDRERGRFHEQLDLCCRPITSVPLRLMVQARQIAVYAAAALSERFVSGGELALHSAQNMIAHYERVDGQPGWIFALGPDKDAVDPHRDLYAHAFVLFALSWVLRLEPRQVFFDAIERTLDYLDDALMDRKGGGFWDSQPRRDSKRRQNPHMHLFEAYVSLYEATGDSQFLERGRDLRNLAVTRFIAPGTGALREYYNDDWSVFASAGAGNVEPGHLFEWSWLLAGFEAASGEDQSEVIRRLMSLAIQKGLDTSTGRIVDEIDETGFVTNACSRSWPHAEALKALTLGVEPKELVTPLLTVILRRLLDQYCPPTLQGGWCDHLNDQDCPISRTMPASTLYHLYFGITTVENAICPVGKPDGTTRFVDAVGPNG
ncbi:mannose-6-phosphate isomerase type 3 [Ensifer adhaerens]|nr:mannose-6-phosphate isomerase type 3 [Ensifer adhaerens]